MSDHHTSEKGAPPSLSSLSVNPTGGPSGSSRPSSMLSMSGTQLVIKIRGRMSSDPGRVNYLVFSPNESRLVCLRRYSSTMRVSNHQAWQAISVFNVPESHRIELYNIHRSVGSISTLSNTPDYRVLSSKHAQAVVFGPETWVEPKQSSGLFGLSSSSKKAAIPPTLSTNIYFLAGSATFYYDRTDHHVPRQYELDTDLGTIDVGSMKSGFVMGNVPIEAPIAVSPDATMFIGRSAEDNSEIYLVKNTFTGSTLHNNVRITGCLPGHMAKVTHLAFMPDGESVVSLAEDGSGRVISCAAAPRAGQTLGRFQFDNRGYPASCMQVSPSGDFVASVWGRQVVRWYPATDQLLAYDLDEVRLVELWPLALSPDCTLLACRTEHGLDVVRVEDGTSAGHINWTQNGGNFATAAAFGASGKTMAVGLMNGRVLMHDLEYVSNAYIDKDAPEDEPPAYSKYDD